MLPPPQISTSSPSNNSIVVSWIPAAYAVQYSVSIYSFEINTEIKYNTTNTSLTFSGLDAGSIYGIEGSAWDPEGRMGEGSLYVNQTTRKETPLFVISHSVFHTFFFFLLDALLLGVCDCVKLNLNIVFTGVFNSAI